MTYRFGGSALGLWWVNPTIAHQWYNYVHVNPFTGTGLGNYSDGNVTPIWGTPPGPPYRKDAFNVTSTSTPVDCPAWMRGLPCDISPHLPIDWHPFWQDFFDWQRGLLTGPFTVCDFHGSNPWSNNPSDCPRGRGTSPVVPSLAGKTDDNHVLYYNPDTSVWQDQTIEPWRLVTSGHINPPRTLQKNPTSNNTQWLWQDQDFGWGLVNWPSTSLPTATSNAWCFAQFSPGSWDVAQFIPSYDWYGIRVNAENTWTASATPSFQDFTNCQTSLWVNGDSAEAEMDFGAGDAMLRAGILPSSPEWSAVRLQTIRTVGGELQRTQTARAMASHPPRTMRVAWRVRSR